MLAIHCFNYTIFSPFRPVVSLWGGEKVCMNLQDFPGNLGVAAIHGIMGKAGPGAFQMDAGKPLACRRRLIPCGTRKAYFIKSTP